MKFYVEEGYPFQIYPIEEIWHPNQTHIRYRAAYPDVIDDWTLTNNDRRVHPTREAALDTSEKLFRQWMSTMLSDRKRELSTLDKQIEMLIEDLEVNPFHVPETPQTFTETTEEVPVPTLHTGNAATTATVSWQDFGPLNLPPLGH